MEISRFFKSVRIDISWSLFVGLMLVAVLFFVWPIPRTISLRDVLLVVCLGLFARLACRNRHEPFPWQSLRIPFGLYLALSVWIVFVALVISDETVWALGEIKGQWLKATIALIAGGLFGVTVRDNPETLRLALTVMGTVLLVHVLYVDYQGLSEWLQLRTIPANVGGLTDGPDKSNYLTNMVLYLLLAELFVRHVFHRRFLSFGNTWHMAVIGLVLFSAYVETRRNGLIELAVILTLGFVLIATVGGRVRRAVVGSFMFVLVVVAALGFLSLREDPRWRTFLETVPIALDIENNKAWISEGLPRPTLADGQSVDWSNYSRIARIRAGLSLMTERPLGVGFGRNAFGHAVEQKYGLRTAHSHSGFIDLGVGIGIPGVILWLAFLGALLQLGYRGVRESYSFPALALLFLTTGYSFRMLVDSTIRDHMLQMFLFLAAFLVVAAVRAPDDKTAPAA